MGFITDEARQAERERRQMMAPDPMAVAIEELERELAKCREKLAAAERRRQLARDYVTEVFTKIGGGERISLATLDSLGTLLDGTGEAALDAALERARRNGYYEGRKEVFDTLDCEQLEGTALMECGHPVACAAYHDNGDLIACGWCQSLEQARRYFIRALGGLCQAQGFAKISIHWDGTGGYGPFYDVGASRERDGIILDRKQLSESELFEILNNFLDDVEGVPDEPTF